MIKTFFLLMMIFPNCFTVAPSKSEVRALYQQAAAHEESCRQLLGLLEPFDESNNALFAGYRGCAIMMMTNYVFNPFKKLSNFSKGKVLLEKAIEAEPENVELRFLRFMVQTNAPSFLGYSNAIEKDKTFLIKTVPVLKDKKLKQFVVPVLLKQDNLTRGEKQNLKNYL